MKKMDIIGYILHNKLLLIFIFISLINSSCPYLIFNYPYAFKLNNRNIFVIHELGITICDETFTSSIDRVNKTVEVQVRCSDEYIDTYGLTSSNITVVIDNETISTVTKTVTEILESPASPTSKCSAPSTTTAK